MKSLLKTLLFTIIFHATTTLPHAFYGHEGMQGKRPTMEDAHNILITPDHKLFGLYDGHGGDKVSNYLADHLNQAIHNDKALSANPIQALEQGYLAIHNNLTSEWAETQGSTAVTALIQNGTLYVANAGDSRAVLCSNGNAIALSDDHKPNRPDERQRIENGDGLVVFYQGCWRVQGILALSRALGDKQLAPHVIAQPEIKAHTLTRDDQFLILACDGVWDVLNNKQAVDIVQASLAKGNTPTQAAHALITAAYQRGSTDNISALVVTLHANGVSYF